MAAAFTDPGPTDLARLRAGILPDWWKRRAGVPERRIFVIAQAERRGIISVVGRAGHESFQACHVDATTGHPIGALINGPDPYFMLDAHARFVGRR